MTERADEDDAGIGGAGPMERRRPLAGSH